MIVKAAGSIVLCKQTSCGRKLSVQRQTKVKSHMHMSYVITFDIWESLYYELILNVVEVLFIFGKTYFSHGYLMVYYRSVGLYLSRFFCS